MYDVLNSSLTTIKNQGDELEVKNKEISKLQNMLARLENQVAAENEDAQSEGKATNRKSTTKRGPKK